MRRAGVGSPVLNCMFYNVFYNATADCFLATDFSSDITLTPMTLCSLWTV